MQFSTCSNIASGFQRWANEAAASRNVSRGPTWLGVTMNSSTAYWLQRERLLMRVRPPPRYLLREYAVKRLLDHRVRGRFLEVGYGGGHMLVSLARLGFSGIGYETSPEAHRVAADLLASEGVNSVRLVD